MCKRRQNMFPLYKLCFIILFGENYALEDNKSVVTDSLRKKNLQFVENLKQDLKRNNDDYVDLRRNLPHTNNTQQFLDNVTVSDIRYKIITTRDNKKVTTLGHNVNYTPMKGHASHNVQNNNDKDDVRIKIIDDIRRRVNDALISKEVVNDPQRRAEVVRNNDVTQPDNNDDYIADKTLLNINRPRPKTLWSEMHKRLLQQNRNVNQYRQSLLFNKTKNLPYLTTRTMLLTTTESTNLKSKKHLKKSKLEKLKIFMRKNKNLLRDFKTSKRQATSLSTATPATPQTLAQTQKHKQSKILKGRELNKIMQEVINGSIDKKSLMELPNPEVLDMFPAKGGRIHSKRINGHLCHRHVLIPEGPKYSSLGRIYLPPHAAAQIAHEYNATELPRLLLPRCCNCCHKSVLGCE